MPADSAVIVLQGSVGAVETAASAPEPADLVPLRAGWRGLA
jgi:hypothetical protein